MTSDATKAFLPFVFRSCPWNNNKKFITHAIKKAQMLYLKINFASLNMRILWDIISCIISHMGYIMGCHLSKTPDVKKDCWWRAVLITWLARLAIWLMPCILCWFTKWFEMYLSSCKSTRYLICIARWHIYAIRKWPVMGNSIWRLGNRNFHAII
jgi:hypothetical protein